MIKKIITGTFMATALLVSSVNSFALTSYQTTTFTPSTVGSTELLSFSFSGISETFVGSNNKNIAFPTLSLNLSGSTGTDALEVIAGGQTITLTNNINTKKDLDSNGIYTYTFNKNKLSDLNAALTNNSAVTFVLESNTKKITALTSATLAGSLKSSVVGGSVAPEPASMALICSGLAALPLVRRFRKQLRNS